MDVEVKKNNKSDKNQIEIDDYIFTIISKNVADFYKEYWSSKKKSTTSNYEDRFKIYFTSKNIKVPNSPTIELYAYTSISEMLCWRVCFLRADNGYNKFDNYIQATILHMELQKFIWDKFDDLPYTSTEIPQSSTLDKYAWINYTNYTKMNGINKTISPRSTNPDFDEKLAGEIEKAKNGAQKNPNGVLVCNFNDTDTNINGRGIQIAENILDFEDKYSIDNYIGQSNIKINIDINYNEYKIRNKIYEIKLTSKIVFSYYKHIIAQVGECELEYNGRTWRGMYILNLIQVGVKINSYGLYSNYFFDTQSKLNKKWNKFKNIKVISKPIEYKSQVHSYSIENDDFENNYYVFIAHYNDDKFIIRELREALSIPVSIPYLKLKEELEQNSQASKRTRSISGAIPTSYTPTSNPAIKQAQIPNTSTNPFLNNLTNSIPKSKPILRLKHPDYLDNSNSTNKKRSIDSTGGNINYKNKYLKYKAKYIELKNKMK